MSDRRLAKPAPLRPGDRLAVVAPAGAPRDLDRYRAGLDALRAAGYDVQVDYDPAARRGYLAAPDAARARALHRALLDPAVRAIVAVRGGYGTMRLLDRLDWAALRTAAPTLVVGYSDLTALHLALYARLGWPSVSGPVVTEWAAADAFTRAAFRRVVTGDPAGVGVPLVGPGGAALRPLSAAGAHGTAAGVLLGGNLSVLTRLLGTPFLPDLTGAVLVLEDVGEAPYRLDRMLAHLALAGVLDRLGGVVLGRFTHATADSPSLSAGEVLADYFAGRPYPVAAGLAYGHVLPRLTLPWGVRARLAVTPSAATLTLLEPAVAPDGDRADGDRADGDRADGDRADGDRADGDAA